MVLGAEREEEVKGFLRSELKGIPDVEPQVLTDYTVALLRNNKSSAECEEALQDFLGGHTRSFVGRVFKHLEGDGGGSGGRGRDDDADDAPAVSRQESTTTAGGSDEDDRRGPSRRRTDDDEEDRDRKRGRGGDYDRDRDRDRDHRDRDRDRDRDYDRSFRRDDRDSRRVDPRSGRRDSEMYDPHNPSLRDDRGRGGASQAPGYREFHASPNNRRRSTSRSRSPAREESRRDRSRSPRRRGFEEHGMRGRGRDRGGRGGLGRGMGRVGYTAEDKANFKKDNPRLRVTKIPVELMKPGMIKGYFRKFGHITYFRLVQPDCAHLTFATVQQAKAAIGSTAAVMNNRFIQVLYRSEDEHERNNPGVSSARDVESNEAAPVVSTEQIVAKMDELKGLHAKLKDSSLGTGERAEVVAQLKAVDKELKGMLERKKAAVKKVAAQTIPLVKSPAAVKAPQSGAAKHVGDTPAAGEKEAEGAEEKEADAEETDDIDVLIDSVHKAAEEVPEPEGAGRGRGRGRGRGFGPMRLDNRPTALRVTNLHPDIRNKELIKGHFKTFGELVTLDVAEDFSKVEMQFRTRAGAELAVRRGQTLNHHAMTLEWMTTAPNPAQPPAAQTEDAEAADE